MLQTELARLRTRLAHMQGESASDTAWMPVCLSIYLCVCVCLYIYTHIYIHEIVCVCVCVCVFVCMRAHTRACMHQVRKRRSWKGSNGSTQSPLRATTSTTSRRWTTSSSATTSRAASTGCCSCNGPASERCRRPTVPRRGRRSVLVLAPMLRRRSRGVDSVWTLSLCRRGHACENDGHGGRFGDRIGRGGTRGWRRGGTRA